MRMHRSERVYGWKYQKEWCQESIHFQEETKKQLCINVHVVYHLTRYRNEPALFAKLAQQCSNISTKDSILYDNYPESNSICFARMTDVKQGILPEHKETL